MTLIEDFDPKKRTTDKYKAEISAFMESGGHACIAERFTKTVVNDYTNYKKAIGMMGLQDEVKPKIRKDNILLWRPNV